MDAKGSSLKLPGFRFKPTEEELLNFYLKNMVYDKKMHLDIIGVLDIYRYSPWDLPGLSGIGEREWYFFVPRDRKHGHGGRPNRTTEHGFWKATGTDRKVLSLSEPKRVIGSRKTLVFYKGRAARGSRTDWVMNEYRLPDNCVSHQDIVLCKIYRKATSLKELEEKAAKEEATEKSTTTIAISCPTSPISSSNDGSISFNSGDVPSSNLLPRNFKCSTNNSKTLKEENVEENVGTSNDIKLPFGKESLGQLQVPKLGLEWAQDPIFSLSFSPWFENLLNFSSPTLMSQFLST